MFSAIRKRITYTNAIMTIALVFAMTGGAYAAKHYLITSTKQISPKVLKQLQGAQGPKGAQGPAGPSGAAGPKGETGPAGAKGETGPTGKEGTPGKNGESVVMKAEPKGANCKEGGENFTVNSKTEYACNGAPGKEGSPWTAGGVLPSGKTETGVWAVAGSNTIPPSGGSGSAEFKYATFSFPIPLEHAPNVGSFPADPTENYIGPEEGEGEPKEKLPPGCKGTAEKPVALAGNLCVFAEAQSSSLRVSLFQNPGEGVPAGLGKVGVSGGVLLFKAVGPINEKEEVPYSGYGTWAVTAE